MKIKFERIKSIVPTFFGSRLSIEIEGYPASDEDILVELCNRNGDRWAAETIASWGPKSKQALASVLEGYEE